MRHLLHRFIRARQGIAFVEFALVAPMIFFVLFGAIELTRFMVIVQKVDKTAYAMADLVAQMTPATAQRRDGEIDVDEMNTVVFRQLPALMDPYEAGIYGSAIVSSIRRERDTTRIKWQIASQGGYNGADALSIVSGLTPASVNSSGASLRDRPASFTGEAATEIGNMLGYENMIVSEVFFRYRPILSDLMTALNLPWRMGETTLVRRIYSRPRNGNMICLPPTFTYDECVNRNPVGINCTVVTGSGSCTDDCGDCRANTREWCTANGSVRNLMRCVNGNPPANQNLPTACAGIGIISCPE